MHIFVYIYTHINLICLVCRRSSKTLSSTSALSKLAPTTSESAASIYIYMHVCICIYMYIYIHTLTLYVSSAAGVRRSSGIHPLYPSSRLRLRNLPHPYIYTYAYVHINIHTLTLYVSSTAGVRRPSRIHSIDSSACLRLRNLPHPPASLVEPSKNLPPAPAGQPCRNSRWR